MFSLVNILSYRKHLQVKGALDLSLCLLKNSNGTVLLPILPSCLTQLDLLSLKTVVPTDDAWELVWSQVSFLLILMWFLDLSLFLLDFLVCEFCTFVHLCIKHCMWSILCWSFLVYRFFISLWGAVTKQNYLPLGLIKYLEFKLKKKYGLVIKDKLHQSIVSHMQHYTAAVKYYDCLPYFHCRLLYHQKKREEGQEVIKWRWSFRSCWSPKVKGGQRRWRQTCLTASRGMKT